MKIYYENAVFKNMLEIYGPTTTSNRAKVSQKKPRTVSDRLVHMMIPNTFRC